MIKETWINTDRSLRILVETTWTGRDGLSPRKAQETLTTFVGLPNRRYHFGDETQKHTSDKTPHEALTHRMDQVRAKGGAAWAVWCYEHDGLVFRLTTGFNHLPKPFDSFDTYPAGAMLVDAKQYRSTDDPDFPYRIYRSVQAELQTYQAWINGDVYDIIRETADTCRHCGHREWKQDDNALLVYGFNNIAAAVKELGGFDPDAEDTNGWTHANGEAS